MPKQRMKAPIKVYSFSHIVSHSLASAVVTQNVFCLKIRIDADFVIADESE